MPSSSRPSARPGRQSAGVYWRRRLFVLGVAASLVLVIGGMLSGGSDGRDPAPAAEQAAGVPRGAGTADDADQAGQVDGAGEAAPSGATSAAVPSSTVPPPPPTPSGPCEASDVVVAPSVTEGSAAGENVPITLTLRTRSTPACTFTVARSTVVVTVSDDKGTVWTTGQCPRAVPTEVLVVRRDTPTNITLAWNARRSDGECSRLTTWVLPGDYDVAAATLGGEPSSSSFRLVKPAPRTITVTEEPKQRATSPRR